AVYADAEGRPDVAINEAVRLVEQEKVDMLLGFYSSAQCVPVAVRVEQLKKFMWITSCISSAVLENRNLKYVFRAQPSGRQFGMMSMDFIAKNAKEKLKKDPKDVKVAIIHEDGAYGIDVAKGNQEGARKAGFNLVLKEGYAATAPDLSSLVIKLKRARPDVLFHTGYNPDIALFLRQAREQHPRVQERGAAPGDQEVRRQRRRREPQGRARGRSVGGRDHAGGRRALRRRRRHGRPERARVPGHRAVHRRQGARRVAEESP